MNFEGLSFSIILLLVISSWIYWRISWSLARQNIHDWLSAVFVGFCFGLMLYFYGEYFSAKFDKYFGYPSLIVDYIRMNIDERLVVSRQHIMVWVIPICSYFISVAYLIYEVINEIARRPNVIRGDGLVDKKPRKMKSNNVVVKRRLK